MSDPKTEQEREQFYATLAVAGWTENVVSTACSECGTRFAMLARFGHYTDGPPGWQVRCTLCSFEGGGELKHG